MIEHRTLGTAARMAADRQNSFIVGPRGPVIIDGFEHLDGPARRERNPRLTVVSGSADYNARPMTIDVTDYSEIKAPVETAKRTDRSLSRAVGPLVVFAAAAVVAITLSLTPASDGPAPVAGPLAGHSILHFPR